MAKAEAETPPWKARAAEILKAGDYVQNNEWEAMLRRHLTRLFPTLVAELEETNDLDEYLVVMTSNAMDYAQTLRDQGTSPEIVRELALELLLPKPPDEETQPEPWELEDSQSAISSAASRQLFTNNPSPSPRPRKTRPT